MVVSKYVISKSEAQQIDQSAIQRFGIPGDELMRRAGQAAFGIFQEHWPEAKRVHVICGSGNNGGDGYVFAANALGCGKKVRLHALGEPKTPEALRACEKFQATGGQVEPMPEHLPDKADVLVDAIFGIGLAREPVGRYREVIEQINHSRKPVLSLDIPSGLDADTGNPLGSAVRATVTSTFIGVKIGLMFGRGIEYAGKVELDSLGLSDEVFDKVARKVHLITEMELRIEVPGRSSTTHKGSAGRVGIIGGNRTMEGAVQMAGMAAFRSGAGLVSVATRPESTTPVLVRCPEIRVFGLDDDSDLADLFTDVNAIGIGPGLGQDDWAQSLFREIRLRDSIPVVVDADALNLLASNPDVRNNWILTPHPGEAGRLLGISTREVERNRCRSAQAIAARYGGVCVLKGAGTLVASNGQMWICDRGNRGMATGGMGDILTGVITALVAQGLTLSQAARLGVWLHARAGDESALAQGPIGMMATDLLPHLRTELNRLIEND